MSSLVSVPVLPDSDTDDYLVPTPAPKKKSSRGVGRIWIKGTTFDDPKEAEDFVRRDNSWVKLKVHKTAEEQKTYYRCEKVPKQQQTECKAQIYLLYHAESIQVSLYQSDELHGSHIIESKRGISAANKEKIVKIFDESQTKPKTILNIISKAGVFDVSRMQLTNFLQVYRMKKYGPCTINGEELRQWCDANKGIPINPHQAFVVASDVSMNDEVDDVLQIFMSTPHLLSMAKLADSVNADTTYKLNWQGYPVFVVGTTDKVKTFHPFGIALCYGEDSDDFKFVFNSLSDGCLNVNKTKFEPTALIADSSDAITNGFKAVFGENIVIIMCWFHVIKNVDKHLRSIDVTTREKIRGDIELLQLCTSNTEFQEAALLFENKWTAISNESVGVFLNHFRSEWLEQHPNWWACPGKPSTNNGLEATNNVIKTEYIFRERLPVGQFLRMIAEKLLPDWSRERDSSQPSHKVFATQPTLTLRQWTLAYQWAKSSVQMLNDANRNEYYVASTGSKRNKDDPLTLADVTLCKNNLNNCDSFDEHRRRRELLWTVQLCTQEWKNATCNCPVFMKDYLCKHSLGLPIRLRLTEVPGSAKTVRLGQKRKRGRPEKARAALIRQ